MHAPYTATGTVPQDSPLRAIAGRTVTAPAETLEDLLRRVTEMRKAGVTPVVQVARPVRWLWIAGALTGTTVIAVAGGVIAIVVEQYELAWTAAGAMLLAVVGIYAVLSHMELER
ncbi:hypothetical protein KIF24_01790 [Micromonospora sp. Llam7]|uniref:hypothetical protein n=1 Tax=Micromonospora tarapacensis TaxID=2835305 RepID=UPI001C82AF81|nr:hypothetical protein [Micromonospora tarapacensis]MBX7264906.1 hypothetical protein [Micromonospora tarapacensis]